jgi:hypothetical protein
VTLFARVPIGDHGFILFEVRDDQALTPRHDGTVQASRGGGSVGAAAAVVDATEASLRKSLGTVTQFSKAVYEAVRAACPDEAEAEFGFDLGVQGGNALIVRGGVNCHVRVKLIWHAAGHGPGTQAQGTPRVTYPELGTT